MNNKNTTIIAVIAIIIALYGAFLLFNKPAVAPEVGDMATTTGEMATTATPTTTMKKTTPAKMTTATPKIGTYTVLYTDSGFSPSILEVKIGGKVSFVNNSSKEMSIASTGIGGFGAVTTLNQGGSVKRGGTFTATFTGVGAWGYMNRLWQGDKGTIVVK